MLSVLDLDPVNGRAVRCKRFSSSWHSAVLHQRIRSLIGAGLLRPSHCSNYATRIFGPPIGTHRADCVNYMDLSRELGRLIGVKFWEVSPLRADPPGYMLHNPLQSGYWRKVWALRCELERGARRG